MRIDIRRALPGVILAVAVIAGVVVAVNADGYRTNKVDLHDPGIWISRDPGKGATIGRVNSELGNRVDVTLTDQAADVLQSGSTVLLKSPGSLTQVDIRHTITQGQASGTINRAAIVGLGQDTLAVFDPGSSRRKLRIMDATHIDKAAFSAKPTAVLSGVGDMAVGVDGYVHVIAGQTRTTYAPDGHKVSDSQVPAMRTPTVTAVGRKTVVLDQATGLVVLPNGHSIPLPAATYGRHPWLQQPGAADPSNIVVVETDKALLEIGLDNGKIDPVFEAGQGGAIQPVRLNQCSYGGWGATGQQVSACLGRPVQADDRIEAGQLKFRVNRDRVYLNNTSTGAAVSLDAKRSDHVDSAWADALTPREQDSDNPDAKNKITSANDNKSDQPPKAASFSVGVRPGRARTIKVLAHPGVVATHVVSVGPVTGAAGTAAVGVNGQTIEFTPATPATSGQSSFTYTVANGSGTAPGTITAVVHPMSQESPPKLAGNPSISIAGGSSGTLNVLDKADDDDGDSILLTEVRPSSGVDQPSYKSNGLVTITGGAPGEYTVPFSIMDDRGQAAEGAHAITVHVLDPATLQVVAKPDFITGYANREIVVRPLGNDIPSGGLRISNATVTGDPALVLRDRSTDTIRFVASKAGDFTAEYEATSDENGSSAKGKILIEVKPTDPNGPPGAGRDDVVVAPGVPVIVPVLANDSDPNGDVLSVSGVDVPRESGDPASALKVEVLKRQYLRITASRPVTADSPAAFHYKVSDGANEVAGLVMVHGVDSTADRSPFAADDTLTLKVDRVGTARVLDNDVDPEGGPLTIDTPTFDPKRPAEAEVSCLTTQGDACPPGTAFIENNAIRVVAPSKPVHLTLAYAAVDMAGNKAGGRLQVNVVDQQNQAPQPPVIEIRTLIGRPVDIPIPVNNADPDGDVVSFSGLVSPPLHGVIAQPDKDGLVPGVGDKKEAPQPNALRFLPKAVGTDVFTYSVSDPSGLQGVGTVLVGVLPPGSNGRPVALPDQAEVLPGGNIRYDVLANDSDPDDDPIALVDSAALRTQLKRNAKIDARDQVVRFDAHGYKPGDTITIPYRIEDDHHQTDDSTLTVVVKDGTLGKPPLAVDDVLDPVAPGQKVRVNVLTNDSDPDGDINAGSVTYFAAQGVTPPKKGVPMAFTMPKDSAVQMRYRLTDAKGQSSSALIIVPLKVPDQLKTTPDQATVEPGGTVRIPVVDNDEPRGKVNLDTVYDAVGGTVKVGGGEAEFTAAPASAHPPAVGGFKYKVLLSSDKSLTAVGVASVSIVSKENHPPSLSNIDVDLPADGETTIDLAPMVSDIDADQSFKFKDAKSTSEHIVAKLDGSKLNLTADKNAYAALKGTGGTTVVITGEDNGEPAKPATGQVNVRIAKSTKPLPVTNPDNPAKPIRKEDGATHIDVLANDVGEGLKVFAVTAIPAEQGTVQKTDSDVIYTPPKSGTEFFGAVTFTYTVADSDDTDRNQTAAVTLHVIDKPAKPGKPVATDVGSRQATLTWPFSDTDKHGDTIDHFQVTGEDNFSQSCPASNCLLKPLTNGHDYHFVVTAVGADTKDGPPSDPSDVVSPNKAPDDPVFTTLVEENHQLTVNWTEADTQEGSALTGFTIAISPGSSTTLDASKRSNTFTGLTNGTDYTVSIYASNRGDGKKEFKSNTATTGALRPYDVPLWGSTKPVGKDLGNGTLEVDWTSPDANGRPVDGFDVTEFKSGSVVTTQHVSDGSATKTTFPGQAVNSTYTYSIVAHNLRGNSLVSPTSDPVVAAGPPLQITSVTAASGDGKATLTFTAPDNQGSAINGYRVTTSPGGTQTLNGAASGAVTLTVSPLNNGTDYSFSVAACNSNKGSSPCGPASPQSNSVKPYGPPGTPGVSGATSGQGDPVAHWSWTTPSGNGLGIQRYEISVDGGGRQNVGNVNSYNQNFGFRSTHSLRVWAINNDSPRSESVNPGSASATTGAPNPSINVYSTGQHVTCSATGGDCVYIRVDLSNYSPNANVVVTCYSNQYPPPNSEVYHYTQHVDGNGNGGSTICQIGPSNNDFWAHTSSPSVDSNHINP